MRKKTTDTGKPQARRASSPPLQNALGPALRAIRIARGLEVGDLAARLQREGWPCSAQLLEKIEAQQAPILDYETFYFCKVLNITRDELFEHLKDLMSRRPRPK